MILTIPTTEAMESLGRSIAFVAHAGDVFILTGELGAGKTTFARGFGEGLAVETPVSSPTFVVAREHPSRTPHTPPLVHIDAYRLGSAAEFEELDIDVPSSIVLAEWSAPSASLLSDTWLELEFHRPSGEGDDFDTDQPRTITLTPHGSGEAFLARVRGALEGSHVSLD